MEKLNYLGILFAAHCRKSSWLVGSSKAVKSMILELLSPLATLHPAHFLAAVGVAWADSAPRRGVLVELLSSLRMFPTSTLIATLRQVIKSPPAIAGKRQCCGSGIRCLFLTPGSGIRDG
jgi:hypothetical protein